MQPRRRQHDLPPRALGGRERLCVADHPLHVGEVMRRVATCGGEFLPATALQSGKIHGSHHSQSRRLTLHPGQVPRHAADTMEQQQRPDRH